MFFVVYSIYQQLCFFPLKDKDICIPIFGSVSLGPDEEFRTYPDWHLNSLNLHQFILLLFKQTLFDVTIKNAGNSFVAVLLWTHSHIFKAIQISSLIPQKQRRFKINTHNSVGFYIDTRKRDKALSGK